MRERSDDTVRDMFDGVEYKKLTEPGELLHDRNNVSVTLNTDGAAIFLSGSNSLWPIMCRLNELPPDIRFNVETLFITSIWFGRSHPNMKVFLSQSVSKLRKVYLEGFQWSKNGEKVVTRVVCPNCCLDAPAVAQVQSTAQFNGSEGCGFCYHPGYLVNLTKDVLVNQQEVSSSDENEADHTNVRTESAEEENDSNLPVRRRKRDVKQVQYSFAGGVHPDRTDTEMRSHMVESEASGKSVHGVKGLSPLVLLPKFNLVTGFLIDFLHAVALGTSKHLLSLWFDEKFAKKNFSIRDRLDDVNTRLQSLKPPQKLHKRFEPLKKFSRFKGNMLEPWLLFYSLPCLLDILPGRECTTDTFPC